VSKINQSNQYEENQKYCRAINAYWKAKGIKARARVEHIKVPLYFEFVTLELKVGEKTFNRTEKVMLKTPKIVLSWEIVSDLRFRFEEKVSAAA